MGRLEFIDQLRRALNGNVSPALVADNVNYYMEYISSEIRKGKTEEEVLDALGDPRLIARTIIDTHSPDSEDAHQSGEFEEGYGDFQQASYNYDEDGYRTEDPFRKGFGQEDEIFRQDGRRDVGWIFRVPLWAWLLLILLIVIIVISFVFSVVSYLAPILIPIIVVIFLIKLFRDWLN